MAWADGVLYKMNFQKYTAMALVAMSGAAARKLEADVFLRKFSAGADSSVTNCCSAD